MYCRINKDRQKASKVDMCAELFGEIASKYADCNGAYTRKIKIG